jgi:hypothetical protein
MSEKVDRVFVIAKAIFNANGHYHSSLTWDDCFPEHRAFYLKQAREVERALEAYELQQRE